MTFSKKKKWIKECFYVSNLVSISRVLFIYPFIHAFEQQQTVLATIYLFYMIASDLLDGYLSRLLKQVSDIGKGLDPLADKLCLGFLLYVLLGEAHVNLIPFYIMLLRDVILIFLGVIAVQTRQPITGADMFGKLTTFFLTLCLLGLFFDLSYNIHPWLLRLSIGFYYLASFILLITFYTYGKTSFSLLKTAFSKKN